MKALKFIFFSTLLFAACGKEEPALNPDPNHTHADFAVWIDGEKIGFSEGKYMWGTPEYMSPEVMDPHVHLHDQNGSVIHRHRPGLRLSDFFATIGFGASSRPEGGMCLVDDSRNGPCLSGRMRLFVNGKEVVMDSVFDYIFNDIDQILLTDATDDAAVNHQLLQLTDDACLYSKTCPERGDPPAENCVADPQIPCQ